MIHYELLYLIAATYTEEELVPIKEKVKELIEKNGGKITAEDSLGKKKLAYPIKNARHSYYLLYELDLEPENIKKLERDLVLDTDVLRHQLVKKALMAPSIREITEQKLKKEKAAEPEAKKTTEKEKIKLEDLDRKLDELLENDII